MTDQHLDFYQNLRRTLHEWLKNKGANQKYAQYIMLAPDLLHLLCKLSVDKDVSVTDKAKLAGVIAYFISPVDLIPEALIGPLGYADDIALSAYVLNALVNNTDPEVIKKHWAGDGDILDQIKNILAIADDMIGSGLWNKLKQML